MRSLSAALTATLSLAVLAPATPVATAAGPDRASTSRAEPAQRAVPGLRVRTIAGGLDHPWDVQPIGGGRLLVTQRDRATLSVLDHGDRHRVRFPSKQVWVSGETGLMSLEVDPAFRRNHRIYTCQGGTTRGGGHEVHVLAWHLDEGATRVRKIKELVGGFPTGSGRHGGCRLLVARDGSLLVGTGDAAQGTNPEDLTSLGGKTLRLDRFSGKPWPTNPFLDAASHRKRYVHTYGHRNVQGLAQRRDGSLWSIEQGTYRDDEVNKLVNGGDYGYDPVPHGPGDPDYDESVPMTDRSLPGRQVVARWSSGDPTLATSGGTFVTGKEWGALDGTLAVAALKASRVLFLTLDGSGHLKRTRAPKALQKFGRIRSVTVAPDHDLLLTTDNGAGDDVVLRVSPR